jgi:hypothetical protein
MRGGRYDRGQCSGRGGYRAFNNRNSCGESKPADQSASESADGAKTELDGSATVIHTKPVFYNLDLIVVYVLQQTQVCENN